MFRKLCTGIQRENVSFGILLHSGLVAFAFFLWRFVNMYQEYSLFFVRPCLASCNVLLMNIDT